MIDAEGPVNDIMDITFADLFWTAMKKTDFYDITLPKTLTYIFELTSPFNRIVTKYNETKVTLLTVRSNISGREFTRGDVISVAEEFGCAVVKAVDARDWQELLKMENSDGSKKDPQFEGYVIVKEDAPSHKRNKLKNPAYLALHKVACSVSERNFMELIKQDLQEEFLEQFPEWREAVDRLSVGLSCIRNLVLVYWGSLNAIEDRKAFAIEALKTPVSHYLFALKDGHSVTVETLGEFIKSQRTDNLLDTIRKVGI
jgi:hypothetical protein